MGRAMCTWKTGSGSVTLMPERGRVLQVTVSGRKMLWENPGWPGDWNVGGDRLWVSPELAWNWKTLKKVDFTKHSVPKAMDPGKWRLEEYGKGYCRVKRDAVLRHLHRKGKVRLTLARHYTLLEGLDAPLFRKCVAYRTDDELRVRSGIPGQAVGLWSLAQVPAGGTLYIPCRGRASYRDYFTPAPKRLRRKQGHILCFDITGRDQYKIGVSPSMACGTFAYARRSGTSYLVLLRRFFPQPWREYCDVPMSDRSSGGDAVQAYNDGGDFGGFGEMEYHSPALRVGRGTDCLLDSSLTIAGKVSGTAWARWKRYWLG